MIVDGFIDQNRHRVKLIVIGVASIYLTACQVNPPTPAADEWTKAAFPQKYSSDVADTASIDHAVSPQFDQNTPWWQQFHDPQLTALIEKTAKQNFDVDLALERVNLARSGAASASADLLPTLYLNGGRNTDSTGYSKAVKTGDLLPDKRISQAGLNFNWDFDIFGAGRAGKAAALKEVDASIWGVYGAQLVASQETASQYFLYQSLLVRKELMTNLIASQQDTLDAEAKRQQVGLSNEIQMDQVEINLANYNASLRQIDNALDNAHHQIALLTVTPIEQLKITPNPEILNQPVLFENIPTGLPIDLLTRRPDIRVAELQLASESDRLVQAERNRLPKTVASLVWGGQDLAFTPSSPVPLTPVYFLNTALSFALPLYDARIKAAIVGQTVKEKTALIQYNKTVFNALTQVENSISVRKQGQKRIDDLKNVALKYQNAYTHTQRLFDQGLTNRVRLQEANRGQIVAQMSLLDVQLSQADATIGLYTALGGSWLPRADQSFSDTLFKAKSHSPLLQPSEKKSQDKENWFSRLFSSQVSSHAKQVPASQSLSNQENTDVIGVKPVHSGAD
ncbi:MAG: efflux transporter outer membrane subunit [Gammaproteobacteria bacterium]|nr:efflux transporter outer membrane subunit [Gammaproteobacteria bacterium]